MKCNFFFFFLWLAFVPLLSTVHSICTYLTISTLNFIPEFFFFLQNTLYLKMSTSMLLFAFFLVCYEKMFMPSKKWINKDAIQSASHSIEKIQTLTHFHLILFVYLKYFPSFFFSLSFNHYLGHSMRQCTQNVCKMILEFEKKEINW